MTAPRGEASSESVDDEMVRRKFVRSMLAGSTAAGLAGLAGCSSQGTGDGGSGGSDGSGTDEADSDGNQGDNEPVEITLLGREQRTKAYQENFNASHDDINVKWQMGDLTGQKLLTQINAGEAPEVAAINAPNWFQFADRDTLVNLDSAVEEVDYVDDIFEPLQSQYMTYDGSTYAFPYWIDLSTVYYNVEHFEEAGLDPENPPQTWEEYRAAAEALNQDGRTPLGMSFFQPATFLFLGMPFIKGNGGSVLNEDKTEVLVDQPEFVEGIEFFKQLSDDGLTPDLISTGWENFHNSFLNEEISILHSGGSGLSKMVSEKPEMLDKVKSMMAPMTDKGDQQWSTYGGAVVAVTKQVEDNSQKRDAAETYVKWTNSEAGQKTAFEVGQFPTRESAFDLPAADEYPQIYDTFQKSLQQGDLMVAHPKFNQLMSPLGDAITKSLNQGNVESNLQEAAKQMNQIL